MSAAAPTSIATRSRGQEDEILRPRKKEKPKKSSSKKGAGASGGISSSKSPFLIPLKKKRSSASAAKKVNTSSSASSSAPFRYSKETEEPAMRSVLGAVNGPRSVLHAGLRFS